MIPFDPHPACRKCGSSMTEWAWAPNWADIPAAALEAQLTNGGVEALRVTCVRCGFAWLMASKEEEE